jgi:hypothetical protein
LIVVIAIPFAVISQKADGLYTGSLLKLRGHFAKNSLFPRDKQAATRRNKRETALYRLQFSPARRRIEL